MLGSARFTTVPSRNTAPEPMMVATRVQRWRGVMFAVSQIDSRGMPGPVALVGAGEFLPAMADVDAGLLASTGVARPRVVVMPTASFPDGEDVFERWASMGVAHFAGLGAEVEPVLVRDRADADDPAAAQALGEADLIYLSGGKPGYLRRALEGTAVGGRSAGRPRTRRRAGGLFGRGDDPGRSRLRVQGSRDAVAVALGARVSSSRQGSPSYRTTTRGRSRYRR